MIGRPSQRYDSLVSDEKRRAERHAVRFHLVYDDGASYNAGTVRDVSEGGLFLETALPLSVGSTVTLTPLDSAGHTTFEVRAEVTRVVPYDPEHTTVESFAAGMGLRFLDLDDAERTKVVEMINDLEDKAQHTSEGGIDPVLGVRVAGAGPDEPATE